MEDEYGYTFEYKWGGRQHGRTWANAFGFDLNNEAPDTVTITGHQQANRILIPPGAKLNTSIYEEAEVVV